MPYILDNFVRRFFLIFNIIDLLKVDLRACNESCWCCSLHGDHFPFVYQPIVWLIALCGGKKDNWSVLVSFGRKKKCNSFFCAFAWTNLKNMFSGKIEYFLITYQKGVIFCLFWKFEHFYYLSWKKNEMNWVHGISKLIFF